MNAEQIQQCLHDLEDAAFGYTGGAPYYIVEAAVKSAANLRLALDGKVLVPDDRAQTYTELVEPTIDDLSCCDFRTHVGVDKAKKVLRRALYRAALLAASQEQGK